jgi:fluoroacetyl-CoA thioesterase
MHRAIYAVAMSKPVSASASHRLERVVEHEHTLSYHHHELPPVLSTPWMIAWMEAACYHALQPYAEGDEITVGTAVNVSHLAPTFVGQSVTAEAVLERQEGRFYVMRVTARNRDTLIGEGTVNRAFVSVARFMAKNRDAAGR